MSDIFISYKREDKPRIRRFAEQLEAEGYSVWWDRKIPPGKSFEQVIQERLDQAACVVVLWSEAAVRSDWVKEEAEKGRSRGVLVPILIDEVPIPLGFGRLQTANLAAWNGERKHPEFQRVVKSIEHMCRGHENTADLVDRLLSNPHEPERRPSRASSSPAPAPARAEGPRRRLLRVALWAAAMAALSISATAGVYYARPDLFDRLPIAAAHQAPETAATDPAFVALEPAPETDAAEPASEATAAVDAPAAEPGAGPVPSADPIDPEDEEEETAAAGNDPSGTEPAVDPAAEPGLAPATAEAADLEAGPPDAVGAAIEPPAATASDPALEAYKRLYELQALAETEADDAGLLERYRELWSEHGRHLESDAALRVLKTIEALESSRESAAAAAELVEPEGLSVLERLAHWRRLAAEHSEGEAAGRVAAELAKLERIAGDSATVAAEDRFVTCAGVARGEGAPKAPIGVREAFRPGTVWVFAWVNSPRASETLRLEWAREDGTVERTHKVDVSRNTGSGYRFFYSKQHAAGRYQVRLFNQDGVLIARRAYTVG